MASITDSRRNVPFQPTRQQLEAARAKTVPNVIAPGLNLLLVGINPGLYSAATGHHFARPGNRFWPTLRASGITPRQFSPFEERELLKLGIGITNIVPRATAAADELRRDELRRGATRLKRLIHQYRPRTVAIVGVGAYREAFAQPGAKLGKQPEKLEGADVWVLPNPSGLNAHYQPRDLTRLFAELREALHHR
jgi:TDG/mug DNA glycosylase family protein